MRYEYVFDKNVDEYTCCGKCLNKHKCESYKRMFVDLRDRGGGHCNNFKEGFEKK